MITGLFIEGFQKHKRRHFDLSFPITVFAGKSDAGKSAALRALRWAMLNEPAGDGFIPWGSEQAEASVQIGNGLRIVRSKGKNGNTYQVNTDEPYHRIDKEGIPDLIVKEFNVDARSFALQFDPPFWLSLSAPQVGRELNEIIDLSVIDGTLGNIASTLRDARTRAKVSEERLKAAREQRTKLAWVRKARESVQGIIDKQLSIESKRLTIVKLEQIMTDGEHIGKDAQNACSKAVASGNLLSKASAIVDKAERTARLAASLEKVKEDTWAALKGKRCLPLLNRLSISIPIMERKAVRVANLAELVRNIEQAGDTARQWARRADESENQFHKKLKGKRCPLCGSNVKGVPDA